MGARETPRMVSAGGVVKTLGGWMVGWLTVTPGSGGILLRGAAFLVIMLLVSPLLPAKFSHLPRVNRILAKTIIHLSFFHSFWAFLAPFFARLDFWPLHFRVGSLYVSLSYFRFPVRFPQPVPYIHERKESPKSFEIRKGTYSW